MLVEAVLPHNTHGITCCIRVETHLWQILSESASECQVLHMLEHGVVLLSSKQCRHCR
jgi:hypothetical protein